MTEREAVANARGETLGILADTLRMIADVVRGETTREGIASSLDTMAEDLRSNIAAELREGLGVEKMGCSECGHSQKSRTDDEPHCQQCVKNTGTDAIRVGQTWGAPGHPSLHRTVVARYGNRVVTIPKSARGKWPIESMGVDSFLGFRELIDEGGPVGRAGHHAGNDHGLTSELREGAEEEKPGDGLTDEQKRDVNWLIGNAFQAYGCFILLDQPAAADKAVKMGVRMKGDEEKPTPEPVDVAPVIEGGGEPTPGPVEGGCPLCDAGYEADHAAFLEPRGYRRHKLEIAWTIGDGVEYATKEEADAAFRAVFTRLPCRREAE